jgi:hypothetical protein
VSKGVFCGYYRCPGTERSVKKRYPLLSDRLARSLFNSLIHDLSRNLPNQEDSIVDEERLDDETYTYIPDLPDICAQFIPCIAPATYQGGENLSDQK